MANLLIFHQGFHDSGRLWCNAIENQAWQGDVQTTNTGINASPFAPSSLYGKLYCFHQGFAKSGEFYCNVYDGMVWQGDFPPLGAGAHVTELAKRGRVPRPDSIASFKAPERMVASMRSAALTAPTGRSRQINPRPTPISPTRPQPLCGVTKFMSSIRAVMGEAARTAQCGTINIMVANRPMTGSAIAGMSAGTTLS